MTILEARKLATRIVKESNNVIVKFGITNSRNCLHLRHTSAPRESQTIYDAADWDIHDWNYTVKKRAEDTVLDGVLDAVANKEAA